jgi:iron complex transport system ATP-binding protein
MSETTSQLAPILSARGLAIGWEGRAEKILAAGISLEVGLGEVAILVGPNGSGKSTLLRTLAGLQPALNGLASLGGTDVAKMSVEERSTKVACVFTDRYDSGYFSVFDIVAFGRYPYTDPRGRLGEKDSGAVRAAIADVGLEALAGRLFAELSDGERQKALIARAIAQDCPLLLLDEPTAFLDAPARVEIFHLAQKLAKASKKALVISTHDIDHALRYADKLWLMDREHRFRSGAPEDLVLSGGIGQAFDGVGFRFDLVSGSFKSAVTMAPLAVEIVGREGASMTWTVRLVERLGMIAVSASGSGSGAGVAPIARVTIEDSEGGPLFAITALGSGARSSEAARPLAAASFEDLASTLNVLLAKKGE